MPPGLLDPAILFFFFGLFAALVRSNLEIPAPVAKFFSLYLLMAIGFKGGVSLAQTGFSAEMVKALSAALVLALFTPAYAYLILRRRLAAFDAAAIAASYGSVSAVTFITAVSYLDRQDVEAGGYMAVALVLMESPAIVMALLLAASIRGRGGAPGSAGMPSMGAVLREAFTDGAHLLLLGSLLIGFLTGEEGRRALDPFTGQIQKGILAFFLLEMGLVVAGRARELRGQGMFLTGFGVGVPLVNALLAGLAARALDLPLGDAFLLCVLVSSASYIVVPAALRHAIPEANAGLYVGLPLIITFPFNIVMGIPLYYTVLHHFWR